LRSHSSQACTRTSAHTCRGFETPVALDVTIHTEILYARMRLIRKLNAASTSQRRLLLRLMRQNKGHVTASGLYRRAIEQDAGISLATVYRTLRLFTEQGLVDERRFGKGRCRYYEVKRPGEHHHMICQWCGRVLEYETLLVQQLVSDVELRHGFKVTAVDISFAGYCPDCLEKAADKSDQPPHAKRTTGASDEE